jgi:hypothetical protein
MASKKTDAAGATSEQQIEVGDHLVAWRWLKEKARIDPEGFLRLVGPNAKRFERLWGAPHWTSDGGKGWTHAWAISRHNLNWMILSGPDSTIYRLRVPSDGEDFLADPRVGIGATAMLSELLDTLTGQRS